MAFIWRRKSCVCTATLKYIILFAVLSAPLPFADAEVTAQSGVSETATSSIRSVSPRTLTISPNGRYLAVVIEPIATGANARIEPQPHRGLTIYDLARDVTVAELRIQFDLGALNASWSSDSTKLAFFALVDGAARLHVYDTTNGSLKHFNVTACSWSTCAVAVPQWSHDGSHIFAIASAPSSVRAIAGETPDAPDISSVQVFYSPAGNTARAGEHRPPQQLVRIQLDGGETEVLAEQPGMASFHVAEREDRIAIISHDYATSSRIGEVAYAVTRLQLVMRGSIGRWTATRLSPTLIMLFGRAASISTTGRYLAYVESSAGGSGDVRLLDLDSGTDTNLTKAVQFAADEVSQLAPVTRFSRDYLPPVWSRDLSTLYVTRTIPTGDLTTPYRSSIWAVPTTGAPSRPVIASELSVLAFASCGGDNPCVGDHDRVVAVMRYATSGTVAIGLLSLKTGAFSSRFELGKRILGETERAIDDSLHEWNIVGTRDLTFAALHESVDSPPDIVVSDKSSAGPKRLGLLNGDRVARRQLTIRNIEWFSATFGRARALLATPADGIDSHTRLVVHIYWSFSGDSREPFRRYDGGSPAWRPLAADGQFAVLVPEVPLPLPESRGQACSEVAARVDEAIEHAIAATGLPSGKVGLYGYSWGGYLANCIATKSGRYAAVVSGAGFSDMFGFCLIESGCLSAPRTLGLPAAPWLGIEDFVAESPAFSAHTVQAPVLLQVGSSDGQILLFQTREMFYALQIAQKPAQLNIYSGRDHSTTVTHPEYWPRTIQWFDRYLRH